MADRGLIAAMVALSVLSSSGKKLSELAAQYRKAYRQIPETNFEVHDKQKTMKQVAESFKEGRQDWLDGLTVNFDDSWFNVRPSNTEPLLRLNAEATTQAQLNSLVKQITELIREG